MSEIDYEAEAREVNRLLPKEPDRESREALIAAAIRKAVEEVRMHFLKAADAARYFDDEPDWEEVERNEWAAEEIRTMIAIPEAKMDETND